MGFNMRGDKSSLALLSSKRVKAYTRSKADEAFALPAFSDAMPVPPAEPPRASNTVAKAEHRVEQDSDNVKQTMLQHESVFKEQLHELHRLYQKQCMLMAESQKGHACHPLSEPPSSNSSLIYNSDSFKLQEDRSFGDASVSKPLDNYQISSAFPTQMVDVKPFEIDAERQKQGRDRRPKLDLERPAECHPMLDLERPADDLPFLDLERPAEEYMHIEQGKENARATGLTCTSVDASVVSSRHSAKENRDFNEWENRDFVSQDPWRSRRLDFCTSYECKDPFGNKERIGEGYSQHGLLGRQCSDSKDRLSAMRPFTKTLDYSHQDSFSCPVEAASTSGLFRGLPDLNGELSSAKNQTSHTQGKPNDHQYIDLEADSRPPNGTSKLPHWLVQPPPKASRVSVPTNFSVQTSEWQQKATHFSPQMYDKPKSLVACTPSPGEIMMTSNLQEPYHPWLHSKTTSQHREISFKEPLRQFFSDENIGAAQGLYKIADISGLGKATIPSVFRCARDNDKMNLSSASRVDRQGIVFDAQAASMDLLSRISSRETAAVSPVMPWYQQKESFSSLMHQATDPEPPCHIQSFVSSADPWQATTSRQVLPVSNVNDMERGVSGMHSTVNNSKGPCLVTGPESSTKGSIFDLMASSTEKGVTQGLQMRGIEAPTWKQVEKPFYIGQLAEKVTLSNNDGNLISTNAFDLNVSCESLPLEEKFDDGHLTESRFHANQVQCCNHQECDTIGGLGWDVSRGNKAPHFNEQQKGLDPQATDSVDRAANKLLAFDVSTRDATLLPNENVFFIQADTHSSQRHRLGNSTCADYCSGEDETGGGLVEVKSSDASGLTSCESRDAAHFESAKARDDSNTSSGEACQSRESGIPCHKEDVALSSNMQSKRSIGLPLAKTNGLLENEQWGSFLLSTMQSGPGVDTKGNCVTLICTEFGDESEAANSITRKHSMETAEAAELLLSLGLDLSPAAEEGFAISDNEKSLDWLANIIPQEENCEAQVLGVDMDGMETHEDQSTPPASKGVAEKITDPFELAVLALEPIDPHAESLAIQTMDRGSILENCFSLPNLRRRSSRRGRAGKDFQREVLQSMTSLSRQEITEDLQIIEGLINSTTEAMNSYSLVPEDKPLSSPDSSSQKKARGMKTCRGRKANGTLNVCSWGESTRRKRMGRQRSQRSCLPPGVQSSPFVNNTGDGVF